MLTHGALIMIYLDENLSVAQSMLVILQLSYALSAVSTTFNWLI